MVKKGIISDIFSSARPNIMFMLIKKIILTFV